MSSIGHATSLRPGERVAQRDLGGIVDSCPECNRIAGWEQRLQLCAGCSQVIILDHHAPATVYAFALQGCLRRCM